MITADIGFPEAHLDTLIDYVKQRNMDKNAATESAYHLLGYNLQVSDRNVASPRSGIPSDKNIITELENLKQTEDKTLPDWFNAYLINLLNRLITT
jgi:hypothetical protein